MIAEASAAMSGIKVAMDMAKGISALKSEAEINQAIIDIQRTLLEAQSAAVNDKQLISKMAVEKVALEQQLGGLNDWDVEKSRYVLTRSKLGAYTYDLRPEAANGEVDHRLCSTCFQSRTKSILNTTMKDEFGEEVECQKCDKKFTLSQFETSVYSI
jgi:hypothetical protein